MCINYCVHAGAFGRVFKGFLQTEVTDDKQRKSLEVAIKTIKSEYYEFSELIITILWKTP